MRQIVLTQIRMASAVAAAARSTAPGSTAEHRRAGAHSERSSSAAAAEGEGYLPKMGLMGSGCAGGNHAADGKQQQTRAEHL